MTDLVKLFKALGDDNRLRILAALRGRSVCVCDLARQIGLSQPTLSHHLKILREAGLVRGEKDGQWTYSTVNEETFAEYGIDLHRLMQKVNPDRLAAS